MKNQQLKGLSKVLLVLCILITIPSCTGSPEALAKKDAMEANRAIKKGNARALDKSQAHSQIHLNKFKNNKDKYFRYVDTYKKYTQ